MGINGAHVFDDLLDRPWFLLDPWRPYVVSLMERIRLGRGTPRISVPPMSEAWLRQYDLDSPKHDDEPSR